MKDSEKCRESCDLTDVRVKIPADLSSTGFVKWRGMKIDTCIASLVNALQRAGVDMRGSCCGHGHSVGEIHLQDGRLILVLDKRSADVWMSHANEMQRRFERMIRDRVIDTLNLQKQSEVK